MKKTILFSFAMFLSFTGANAQATADTAAQQPVNTIQKKPSSGIEKRINLYGAYAFDDHITSSYDNYNYFDGTVKGGFVYGAGIEFVTPKHLGIELLYMGQNTTAPATYSSTNLYIDKHTVFDLNFNYAMLGINRYVSKAGGKLEGYGGLNLGALFVNAKNPDTGNSSNATKFALGFRLGGNIWATDKIGIKLQAQFLSAVQSVGGSLYFGTGGSGAGVSTYSTMLQLSLGGGLVFRLGH